MSVPAPHYLTRSTLFNRCNLSPWALASQEFQANPQPVEISWIRAENDSVFDGLGTIDDPVERGLIFHEFALSRHWLHEERDQRPPETIRRRNSYAAIIQGWGQDSSGPSGAVLKGWAENRFGLRAIYHQGPLHEDGIDRYVSPRGATAGIAHQLDLLYTFCQDELRRRNPGIRWLTLYRGTHDPEAYTVKGAGGGKREQLVEFNTISSFTSDPEIAWEFGSRVWKVEVPLEKIVYFSGLLPLALLQGEREYMVLGGDYLVRTLVC